MQPMSLVRMCLRSVGGTVLDLRPILSGGAFFADTDDFNDCTTKYGVECLGSDSGPG